MKVATIVGARPQFIKAAVVSQALRPCHDEILIHTGQHYDDGMSSVFFRDMAIPEPAYHLGIGSGPHGAQTGRMLMAIEEVLQKTNPDWVVVYGDTNSTLAGALAAVKMRIPIAHVEAGLRSFNWEMPEECNRVLTDRCSTLRLCPSELAVGNLSKEGMDRGVHVVGDVMYDALLAYAPQASAVGLLSEHGVRARQYVLATVHRPSNTDCPETLSGIMRALANLGDDVLMPLHPRTAQRLPKDVREEFARGTLHLLPPQGYLAMLALTRDARIVVTDSGGLQKEAYWFGVPCLTLRNETEWAETVDVGWNRVVGTDPKRIAREAVSFAPTGVRPAVYGNGNAAEKCVRCMTEND